MDSSPSGRPQPAEVRIRMAVWQRTTPLLPLAVLTTVLFTTAGTEFPLRSTMGIRTIVLHEANGRGTELRAPTAGFLSWDRHFEKKFHTTETWWQTHRGPDWTPIPPPPAWWNTPPTPERDPLAPPK